MDLSCIHAVLFQSQRCLVIDSYFAPERVPTSFPSKLPFCLGYPKILNINEQHCLEQGTPINLGG